jgi:hypothetical protein
MGLVEKAACCHHRTAPKTGSRESLTQRSETRRRPLPTNMTFYYTHLVTFQMYYLSVPAKFLGTNITVDHIQGSI